MIEQAHLENRILSRLSPQDFALLAEQLEPVQHTRGEVLAHAGQLISYVYFLESGITSVVVSSPEGQKAEGGIIGREGFVHPAVVLGSESSPHVLEMQMNGSAHRLPRAALVEATARSASLQQYLLRFAHVYTVQVASTALSNAVHELDERLARWLLMLHDRSASDEFAVTHEFISLMLAVRRPSVTNALHVLEGNHFIASERGYITIRNRAGLEEYAADAYGLAEAEYRRLLGPL